MKKEFLDSVLKELAQANVTDIMKFFDAIKQFTQEKCKTEIDTLSKQRDEILNFIEVNKF